MPQSAEYGFWKSPVTSDVIAAESIRLGEVAVSGDDVYWIEGRPNEGGRGVIVRRKPGGTVEDVNPPPFNARTRVHEYGGGSFLMDGATVYFSNFRDQRLYRCDPGRPPAALTREIEWRYADAVLDRRRQRLVCVREDHTRSGSEAVNSIAAVELSEDGKSSVLVEGNDFYSSPRLNPDETQLAWLTWNHPNMPWDGTELWVAEVNEDGRLSEPQRAAGGAEESIFQPQWSPGGELFFVSDRSGWWNLCRFAEGQVEAIVEAEAEFGVPQWIFGQSTYAFTGPGEVVCAYAENGIWRLGRIGLTKANLDPLDTPYTDISQVRAAGKKVVFRAGSPTEPAAIVSMDADSGKTEILKRSFDIKPDLPRYFSAPETIEFPTTDDLTAYGFFYPPHNPDYEPPEEERPPLIVKTHGGPTGATSNSLSLEIQFWTSRGFAVLDVNYGGSTGYGRAYRERLAGKWGIVDVDDCVNGARHLAEQGRADGDRLIIRGGSAGGYTTLAVLTFHDAFKAGASYYGVGDLEALARDTHKFESRYLDKLVGPYPERRDLYVERSPVHFIDRLSAPVIFFQGSEDRVVPLNQAEMMVEALRKKGLPVSYLLFDGEQHGFRRSETIKRCLDAELYFYATMLLKKGLRF